MAINYNNIAEKTMKIMQGYGFQVKMFDESNGKSVASPEEARYFYVETPNMMVHLDDDTEELKLHLGERTDIDDTNIDKLIKTFRSIARNNMIDFDIRTFGKHIEPKNYAYKIKNDKEQTMSDIMSEGLSSLEGSSRTSRQTLENVRLIVKHRTPVNEEQRGARSRNISAIFIENAEGERFKYPFKHLNGARAMARHVATGGVPSDMVGEAIVEKSENLAKLKEFMNVVNKQGLVNEGNRSIVANVKQNMDAIKESIKRIQSAKGYASFVESLALTEKKDDNKMVCKDCGDEMGKPTTDCKHDCHDPKGSHWVKKGDLSEDTVNDYVAKFTKSTFEESLKDILPLVHRVNEEEMENNRANIVARVKEIITATDKKTGEKKNRIYFPGRTDGYDMEKIKKQYAEPRNAAQAAEQKIMMMALQFDDIADRVDVDTTDDKKRKNKGHDRAAELSNFLHDFANDIRQNPNKLNKEKVQLAGYLMKLSKQAAESVEENSSLDEKFDTMISEAFSGFNIPE